MKLPTEPRFSIIFLVLAASFSAFAVILSVYNLLEVRELRKEYETCKSHIDELDEYYQEKTNDEKNLYAKHKMVEDDDDSYNYGENYVDDDESVNSEEDYSSLEDNTDNHVTYLTKKRKSRSTDENVPVNDAPHIRHQGHLGTEEVNKLQSDEPKFKLNWNGRRADQFAARRRSYHRLHRVQRPQNYALSAAPLEYTSGISHNKTDYAKPMTAKSYSLPQGKAFRAPLWSHPRSSAGRALMDPERKNLDFKKRSFRKSTAIHFEGDSSNLVHGRSPEYLGNGKVKLLHNIYSFWTPASWTHVHGMHNYFSMDGGKVTIKDHGLFLIYAQVFYSDVFDTNGFSIEQNDVSKLQCVTTIHSETRVHKINTCSTSGLVYLNYGDKIWIKDLGNHRHVLLEPSKSFFGLIKINLLQAPIVENSEVESFNIEK